MYLQVAPDKYLKNRVSFRSIEGEMDNKRSLSDRYWAQRGWTSANMNGAYVGCPEMPDGSKPVCVCMYVCERERESVCVNNRFMYKY